MVRIFSLKRLLLSSLLGLLVPLAYAFALSELIDYTGRQAPEFMVLPFGWPRPLWVFLMGRQPSEDDIVGGLVFMAISNILLWGLISYIALLSFSLLRKKRVVYESPPQPDQFNLNSK